MLRRASQAGPMHEPLNVMENDTVRSNIHDFLIIIIIITNNYVPIFRTVSEKNRRVLWKTPIFNTPYVAGLTVGICSTK